MTEGNRAAFDYLGWSLQTTILSLQTSTLFLFSEALNCDFPGLQDGIQVGMVAVVLCSQGQAGFSVQRSC